MLLLCDPANHILNGMARGVWRAACGWLVVNDSMTEGGLSSNINVILCGLAQSDHQSDHGMWYGHHSEHKTVPAVILRFGAARQLYIIHFVFLGLRYSCTSRAVVVQPSNNLVRLACLHMCKGWWGVMLRNGVVSKLYTTE
jgi:hypothetical protein